MASERLPQQLEALARANDVRSRRARLKRDLKGGRTQIEEVLSDPPEYVASATILDLLIWTPKRRRITANKVLLRCRISPSRSIGALTDRQRRVILTELDRAGS
jgi:hypothetical protein